ncbi:MAG: hypothetical protein CMP23_17290 [Rickettsiales bacterium]|nr:hypothetical protein [Rickettsiales bacterium]|tara:strand:+ start:1321 stop:1611 length:291 start_codon:yes stop_codon:yes gene_type:complete
MPTALQVSDEQQATVERVGRFIVRFGLTVPAILALETLRPLSFVGSQFMYLLSPAVTTFLTQQDWDSMAGLLEHRDGIEYVLQTIERLDREQTALA